MTWRKRNCHECNKSYDGTQTCCTDCAMKKADRIKRLRERLVALGKCIDCFKVMTPSRWNTKHRCERCNGLHNKRRRAQYGRERLAKLSAKTSTT